MQGFLEALNRGGQRLSKGHRRIADFLEVHYDKASFMTASKLGKNVGVSESTVVRFAHALGYEGYPQMQKAMREIVRHRLTPTQRIEIAAGIPDEALLPRTVLRTDMANIRATIEQLDTAVFSRVVEEISGATSLYVLGLRSAAPLAQFLGHYLHFIFDNVRILGNGSADVFEIIARIRPGDVLIAISFPRYSNRTLESMHFARACGVKVIGLTDGPMSPMHEASDLCLDARTDMVSFVDSLAAPLSLINALLAALGARNRDVLNRNLSRMEGLWETYRVYAGKE